MIKKMNQHILLTFGAILIIVPLYLTVVNAMKTSQESASNFFALPSSLNFSNFVTVVTKNSYFTSVGNSVFILIGSVLAICIIVPICSYAIARNYNKYFYYRFLYIFIIMGIFIPFQVKMIPLVKLMTGFKLMNHWGLIILYVAGALTQGVFLMVGYIRLIPLSLEEAAYMDGCNTLQNYIKIVLPLTKPMLSTIIIINGLWVWNDFLMPLLILNRTASFWTLPLFQYNFKSQYTFDYNLAFASFTLAMLPIMILYVLIQKRIVGGLTAGAVKD